MLCVVCLFAFLDTILPGFPQVCTVSNCLVSFNSICFYFFIVVDIGRVVIQVIDHIRGPGFEKLRSGSWDP